MVVKRRGRVNLIFCTRAARPCAPDATANSDRLETAAHRFLLDTNIVSDLVRDPQGSVARRTARSGETAVCTSIVVACELRYGAAKKGSPRLSAQLESILEALSVLPMEAGADRHYGEIRSRLERLGRPVGANDLFDRGTCALGRFATRDPQRGRIFACPGPEGDDLAGKRAFAPRVG